MIKCSSTINGYCKNTAEQIQANCPYIVTNGTYSYDMKCCQNNISPSDDSQCTGPELGDDPMCIFKDKDGTNHNIECRTNPSHEALKSVWHSAINLGFVPSDCEKAFTEYPAIHCDSTSTDGTCQCMGTNSCGTDPHCITRAQGCSSIDSICKQPYTPPTDNALNAYCSSRKEICGSVTSDCDIYAHPEIIQKCIDNGGDKIGCGFKRDSDADNGPICSDSPHPDPNASDGWTDAHKQDLKNELIQSSPPCTKNIDAITQCVVNDVVTNSGYTYAQFNGEDPKVADFLTKSLAGCYISFGGIASPNNHDGLSPNNHDGLSPGAIVGIIIGVLLLIVFVLYLYRKQQ